MGAGTVGGQYSAPLMFSSRALTLRKLKCERGLDRSRRARPITSLPVRTMGSLAAICGKSCRLGGAEYVPSTV